MGQRFTRRRFLKAAGAGAAWIALTQAAGCESSSSVRALKTTPSGNTPPAPPEHAPTRHSPPEQMAYVASFRSRPDLGPPTIDVTTPAARDAAPGYVFVAPKKGIGQYGAMIVDDRGQLVWFRPVQNEGDYAMDFKVQSYRGEPVLTWAEGKVVGGHGLDEYIILDGSYREVARVRAGNGYTGDHHEFLITPQDTALITIYGPARRDLSSVGGPTDGAVLDGIIQEVDIETGEVLFEWHSLDHVALDESLYEFGELPGAAFDHFHINSIGIEDDGNLLVSARITSAVYKIDRKTGEIMWRLGGKKSDFEMGRGTRTLYQHHARRHPDGTITIFDNGGINVDEQSRGIVLELDEEKMSATLVREYTHPARLLAATQGSVQVLENGNVFVGWGNVPVFSEFSKDGDMLFSASFPPEDESYRAFRFPWSGRPRDGLAAVAEPGPDGELTIHASWNGATEVAAWQVLAGPGPDRLEHIASAPRDGFETTIEARTDEPYIAVRAKNGSGRVLGTTEVAKQVG